MINHLQELAVTKLDVLDGLKKIKICTAYKYKGRIYREFPSSMKVLESCQPVYEEHPGWPDDTSQITHFMDLPSNARRYIKRLEKLLKVRISMVSVGSAREQIIHRDRSSYSF